ncbi:hypothetical protein COCVIDRAFT_11182 [Bipolaris victoriae FI3]|uniref:Peptidase A1 domain-containing protein n=1 Tax=Bipolaris victoriae (strain FI3) TaxID=930091 RepID=W7FA90_BIPV3|nr:hypothetical protein COCVIDRAFT_11182 [Bipolaris victoriae FI3]
MVALRTSLHATVAALILVSSHAISTALEDRRTNSDGDFRPRADVPTLNWTFKSSSKSLEFRSMGSKSISKLPVVKRNARVGISPLEAIQFQAFYGIDAQVGGKTSRMLVDTGAVLTYGLPSENVTWVDRNLK